MNPVCSAKGKKNSTASDWPAAGDLPAPLGEWGPSKWLIIGTEESYVAEKREQAS